MTSARIEYALIFSGLSGPRLQRAARLIASLPTLAPFGLVDCALAWSAKERVLIAQPRLDALRAGPEFLSRLSFWTSQLNASFFATGSATPRERFILSTTLGRCETRLSPVASNELAPTLQRILAGILNQQELRQLVHTSLQLELSLRGGGTGVLATSNVSEEGLFVATPCSPPMGDRFNLALRLSGTDHPIEVDVRVTHVRGSAQARLGEPAGFGVSFLHPSPELVSALRASLAASPLKKETASPPRPVGAQPAALPPRHPVETRRTHPRVPVHAPASLQMATDPELRLQYDDPKGFVSDYVSNLSMGGAFVRTKSPPPLRSKVRLRLQVLDELFVANGEVVHIAPDGVGLQFELDSDAEFKLSSLVVRLSTSQGG